MKVVIKNQTCHLLAAHAVFWEERKTLIIADIHIGKAAVFRKHGIPIPEGNMADDLYNIARLIKELQVEVCIIVGDLIHAKSGLTTEIRSVFANWLQEIKCEVHLVMGNHDRGLAKALPNDWRLYLHQEFLLMEPFYFSHYPMKHPNWFVWSGHIHPKIEVKNGHDKLILRCFQIFPNLGILPAFSSFVGGSFVKKDPKCQIYAIAGSTLLQL